MYFLQTTMVKRGYDAVPGINLEEMCVEPRIKWARGAPPGAQRPPSKPSLRVTIDRDASFGPARPATLLPPPSQGASSA